MRKLLHERLRDGELDYCIGEKAGEVLADEIERYYIPRPRFEDGEPVRTGTRAMTRTGQEGIVVRLECNYGNEVLDTIVKCENGEEDCADVIVKRPQPKVLDADGVEIKVGDTVWSEDGEKFEVAGIDNSYPLPVKLTQDGEFISWNSGKYLTHKEPDSLEKLRDDMGKFRANTHFASLETEEPFDKFLDRLSALIERGA